MLFPKLNDIRSLTEFQRNAKALLKQMKKSASPVFLTVNGRAAAVVMTPELFDRLYELADRADAENALEEAMEQHRRGEGRPWEEVKAELMAKYAYLAQPKARGRRAS